MLPSKARKIQGYRPNPRVANCQINAELVKESRLFSQDIVMRLIEKDVKNEYFQKQLVYITPEQYDDVTIERALSGYCGYPLCQNDVNEIPNQQYIIRSNNVYDITERKNFCSNKCYEAYTIIRPQVPETPLYTRSNDNDIVKLKIILPDLSFLKGKYGRHYNVKGIDVDDTILSGYDDGTDTNETTANIELITDKAEKLNLSNTHESKDISTTSNRGDTSLNSLYKIEQCMKEWMSFDALIFVLGEIYVKGMLEHAGKSWEDHENLRGLHLDIETKGKYIELCKKLDADEINDACEQLSRDDKEEEKPSKPLPNYEQLKSDAEAMALQVRSFYEGEEYTRKNHESLETIFEELDNHTKGKSKNEKVVTLPLIDTSSQNAWRRLIVYRNLRSSLTEHTKFLNLDSGQITKLIPNLISTFDFTPKNIIFTTKEWKFISLFLIKMLSIRYPAVMESLNNEYGSNYVNCIIEEFGVDPDYFNRLISFLTEINYVLGKGYTNSVSTSDSSRKQNEETVISHDVPQEMENKISTSSEDLD